MLAADGWFEAQVRALQQSLRTRCFALVEAANVHLRGLVTFRVPAAGMFLWCSLVAPATTAASLIDGMRQHGVCVLPGGFASVTKGATNQDEIDLQGEYGEQIKEILVQKWKMEEELVIVVDKSKK